MFVKWEALHTICLLAGAGTLVRCLEGQELCQGADLLIVEVDLYHRTSQNNHKGLLSDCAAYGAFSISRAFRNKIAIYVESSPNSSEAPVAGENWSYSYPVFWGVVGLLMRELSESLSTRYCLVLFSWPVKHDRVPTMNCQEFAVRLWSVMEMVPCKQRAWILLLCHSLMSSYFHDVNCPPLNLFLYLQSDLYFILQIKLCDLVLHFILLVINICFI